MIQNWLTVEKLVKIPNIFAIFMIAQIKKMDLEALFSEFKKIPTVKILILIFHFAKRKFPRRQQIVQLEANLNIAT